MYIIQVGIEHLRTGIEFDSSGGAITIHYQTPTLFMACSLQPFTVYWPVKGSRLHAQYQHGYEVPVYCHDDVIVPQVSL